MNDSVPEAFRGLDRYAARKQVVAALEALGLVEKIELHTHTVPHGDRSGVAIEPRLSDQWYVDARKLAVPAPVADAIGEMRRAWVNMPPSTLLDTLLLANQFAPVPSPLGAAPEAPAHGDSALDFVLDEEMLDEIRREATETRLAMDGPLLV